jgi:hypothetical protein
MKTPIEFMQFVDGSINQKWSDGSAIDRFNHDILNETIKIMPIIVDGDDIESIECLQEYFDCGEKDKIYHHISKVTFKNGNRIFVNKAWKDICATFKL